MKNITLSTSLTLLAATSYANTLVQTETSYLSFDAISYTSAINWTAIEDSIVTSTAGGSSLSDGSVMVYANTGGIDSSTANNTGAADTDKLTYTLDFTTADTYSFYVRAQTGMFDNNKGTNDSIFVPTSGTITGGESANFTRNNLNQGVSPSPYSWYEVGSYTIELAQATSGTSISFSIAGREGDFQLDRLVFHETSGLGAATLDALTVTVVPEPSSYALIAGALALGSIMVRRRK